MNNYSSLQRFWHQFSLSHEYIRQMSFDLERSIFLDNSFPVKDNHVFVAALARAGTTSLLTAIHDSEEFASLTYADMPFVLAPNLWDKLNPTTRHKEEQERVHGDGIKVSTNSPEAFEEVFWQTITQQDISDQFENYIQLILQKYQKKRYLSKNNQNIKRLDTIIKLLPNSKILIPFRNPLQHANSLLNQHLKFSEMQKKDNFVRNYMDWIGHSEFGLSYHPFFVKRIHYKDPNIINHWLEQWYLIYSDLIMNFQAQKNVIFICYESLCSNNSVWTRVKSIIEIKNKYDFDFIESRKDIDLAFDQELYGNCIELYDKLEDQTNRL